MSPLQTSVRLAGPDDADAIAGVLRESFVEYQPLYTPAAFAATVIRPDEVRGRMRDGPLWVGETEGRVVATAGAVVKGYGLYIRGMAVAPRARGFGLGLLLLEAIEAYGRGRSLARLFLSTTPFLSAAIHRYECFGFRRVAEGPLELFGTPLFTMEKPLGTAGARRV